MEDMWKHPETKHEIEEEDHEDRRDMLEELHDHAEKYGPEHHEEILRHMLAEHAEYEPNKSSEESDEEDEETKVRDNASDGDDSDSEDEDPMSEIGSWLKKRK